MEPLTIFWVGLVVSLVSSIVGGLGMFALAGLFALGLPAYEALGTLRLGTLAFSLGGLLQYAKAKKIVWDLVVPLSLIGVVGSVIGIKIILTFDEALIEKMIGVAVLFFIPLSIFKPKLGLIRTLVTPRSRILGHVSVFVTSIWGGAITIGTGFLVLYSQIYFYGLTILEVKGTNRIPNIVKTIVGLGIFSYFDFVDWYVGALFGAGMFVGAYIGTHYAIKIGDGWLRYILLGSLILFSAKLIFDL